MVVGTEFELHLVAKDLKFVVVVCSVFVVSVLCYCVEAYFQYFELLLFAA